MPQKPGRSNYLSSTIFRGKGDYFHDSCQIRGKQGQFSPYDSCLAQTISTAMPLKHFSLRSLEQLVGETTPDLTSLCTHRVQELLEIELSSLWLTLQSSLSHCMQEVDEINQPMPTGCRQHGSPWCCIPRGPSAVRADSLAQPKGSICAIWWRAGNPQCFWTEV